MSEGSPTSAELLLLLSAAPRSLARLTRGLPAGHLNTRPSPRVWSANDVLAHLRSCADVWGDYIVTMAAEDRVSLRRISPRTWIKRTNYPELGFGRSLRAFTAQRADLLATLEPLSPEGWAHVATLTRGGVSRQRSVQDIARGLATHEQEHLLQIERIARRARVAGATS